MSANALTATTWYDQTGIAPPETAGLSDLAPAYDVAIVGGGLAGVALLQLLGEAGVAAVLLERGKIGGGSTAAAQDYNARADALQKRATEWNARNASLAETSRKLVADREFWADECGNRRYREDDEKAILQGQ